MTAYELRPFALPEAERVASWAAAPEDGRSLTASEDPVTADTVAAWIWEVDYAFTLRRDGELVAYGDIVEDVVEQDIEIPHLLVAPDMRGLGIGQALLSRLCAFAAATRPYPEMWLRVGRDNPRAAACAAAVGFTEASGASGPRFVWMKKPLRSSNQDFTPLPLEDFPK